MQGHCGTFHPMEGNPDCKIREIFARWIRNTAQGIRILTNQQNPESKFQWQIPESSTLDPLHEMEDSSEKGTAQLKGLFH